MGDANQGSGVVAVMALHGKEFDGFNQLLGKGPCFFSLEISEKKFGLLARRFLPIGFHSRVLSVRWYDAVGSSFIGNRLSENRRKNLIAKRTSPNDAAAANTARRRHIGSPFDESEFCRSD